MIKVDEHRAPGPMLPKAEKQAPFIKPTELEEAAKFFAQYKMSRWFDLDHYSRYRDPLLVIGFVMVVGAVARYSIASALALFGLGIMYVSYLMGK